jgi:16S rRNA (adenine1518-N6/adenine1519-N6)-dimethyltransferase
MDVPARLFTPPPKVDSAVVVIDPLDDPFEDLKALGELTHACFGQRRKMMRASLKTYAKRKNIDLAAWLASADVDPQARPETIPVGTFQRLVSSLPQASN